MYTKKQIGIFGETKACRWLETQKYKIIEKNYFARVGEIDIIACYVPTNRLCFIEVKTRKYRDGTAEYAHSVKKQQKIRHAAMVYCQKENINREKRIISFEHISIYTHEKKQNIDHYILSTP